MHTFIINFIHSSLSIILHCSAPYLLFTRSDRILQLYLNETIPSTLLTESGAGIIAVDYHFRYKIDNTPM